jgi:hypothetical protein
MHYKKRVLPPKLREIIAYNWEFPVDFPVVNNNISPDATRTLKAVIVHSLQNYYYDHRIFTTNVLDFNRHLEIRLFNTMAQHQYWIDQFLTLIEENQFFYNDTDETNLRTVNGTTIVDGLTKESDTPQNDVSDLDNYLSGATKTDDTATNTGTVSEHNVVHKSTLGDITVQFNNFANFPDFLAVLLKCVVPCFITTYTYDYDDDFEYVGFRFERASEPDRTLVYDILDRHVATFTDGAKTVALKGIERTFTETTHTVNDTFSRTVSDTFGRAEQGGRYFITESVATDFNVSDGTGKMICSTVNASRRATLTQTNTLKSFEGQVKLKTDKAAEGAGQDGGITFGYVDLLNHYEVVLRFSSSGSVQVGIIKKIDGDTNNIGDYVTVVASRTISDWWRLKMFWNSDTGQIKVKAWIVGDPEPSGWQKEEVDTTYTVGRLGLRSILNPGTTNAPVLFEYDDFVGTGQWPYNPTVTHDTHVRFLNYPYNNVNDSTLVSWLQSALKDTSNDFLAEGMRYLASGDLNASYGPLEVDGTRQDGSDWNDYLSQTAYYPGEVEDIDPPEPEQLGCVDCSGFLRLHLRTFDIPLSRYPAVFDGIHLPRESKDILDDGPGIFIYPRNGTVQLTEFSKLQIGDIVGFDADLTDPEEGQIDHLGVYIGLDTQGKRRFLSSRATPDGATFADLGGKSIIDGTTNLYTKSLRCVRRI